MPPFFSIEGITSLDSGPSLKKNWIKVPATLGFSIRGDSGYYTDQSEGTSMLGWYQRTFSTHSVASSVGFFPLTRNAGTGRTKSPLSSVWVHCSAG